MKGFGMGDNALSLSPNCASNKWPVGGMSLILVVSEKFPYFGGQWRSVPLGAS